ncbi:MAG: hypothetical protein II921_05170 [Treponema sp.]|nr:hypothetical protein [Treponema sp.]
MKKSFIVSALLLAATLFTATAFEAGKSESDYKYQFQESGVYYKNYTVYRVLDHKDAFVILYAKPRGLVGSVSIPKAWYSTDGNTKAKLSFRPLPKGMAPWMTVLSRDGSFDHVVLTLPVSRTHAAWGVASSDVDLGDLNNETLELN